MAKSDRRATQRDNAATAGERGMYDGQIAGNVNVNETEVRRTGEIPESVRQANDNAPLTPSAQNAADAQSGVPQNERINP